MRFTPKIMAEISISAALALVLSFIKFSPVAQGGSISLTMVPIFILALRRGWFAGLTGGALLGFIQLLVNPFIVHPLQLILDYPLAYGLLGISGFWRKSPLTGIVMGGMARFLAHFVSGAVFFGSYAPKGANVWLYSLAYNASYMVPEIIISCIAVFFLIKKAPALLNYEA